MDRAQKAESIETLKGVFAEAGSVVVTHNLGLTVAEMEDLRGRLRKEGGAFKVVKNRLALKALEAEEGSDYHGLFKGPVGIAYAPDAVTAEKAGLGVVTAYDVNGNPVESKKVYLTAAQYTALPVKDPNTDYFIS